MIWFLQTRHHLWKASGPLSDRHRHTPRSFPALEKHNPSPHGSA